MRIAFLVSGGGGNLRFIYNAALHLGLNWEICAVLGDRNCHAIQFAKNSGLFNAICPYNQDNYHTFNQFLTTIQADIVITNIHKILTSTTLDCCPNTKFINLHYSLLPAYSGLIGMKPLHEAKVNNARIVGATTHEVIEKVDAGKIVSQAAYSPDWSDMQTEEDTLFKIGAMTLFSSLLIYNGINCNSEICMVNDNKVFLTDFHTDLMKLNSTEFWQKI